MLSVFGYSPVASAITRVIQEIRRLKATPGIQETSIGSETAMVQAARSSSERIPVGHGAATEVELVFTQVGDSSHPRGSFNRRPPV